MIIDFILVEFSSFRQNSGEGKHFLIVTREVLVLTPVVTIVNCDHSITDQRLNTGFVLKF